MPTYIEQAPVMKDLWTKDYIFQEAHGSHWARSLHQDMRARSEWKAHHMGRTEAMVLSMISSDEFALLHPRIHYSTDEVLAISRASALHDIGVLFIDEKVVNKTSPLDKDEWAEMKKHVREGHKLAVPYDGCAAQMLAAHHEIWTPKDKFRPGLSYPRSNTQVYMQERRQVLPERIRVAQEIISQADVIDALANYRPYRNPETDPPFTDEEVKQYLELSPFNPGLTGVGLATLRSIQEGSFEFKYDFKKDRRRFNWNPMTS